MSAKLASKLLIQRRFLPLFTLFQTGTFNDNTLKNALIAMITFGGFAFLSDLPSAVRVPVAALIFTAPFTILCAIAGQIADKFDRGTIFRWVKRAEVLIMALAALGFALQNVHILALCLGLMGAQSAFFSPTKNAVLPQWLSEKELITGNALMSGFQFSILLIGTVIGLGVLKFGTPLVSALLFGLAIVGWIAAEMTPPAPPPQADLNVDYNPVTATLAVLRKAFANPNVLRPLLGVAWFYGLSTVFVTTFPDYVASVMGYEEGVLMIMLASSTIAILVGSLLTLVIGDWKIWGPESVGLAALGISGVTLCVLLLYLLPSPTYAGAETFGPASDFLANPDTPRFMATIIGASVCNGLFLVPLQAMAQRRSNPNIRAQLMSAGSVLLNLFVNITTFSLIALAAREVSPKMPFLMIAIGSAIVASYAIYRTLNPVTRYIKTET